MWPAIRALLYLARTRTVAVEIPASFIDSDKHINDYLADAFTRLIKIAPALLRDDIADRMLIETTGELVEIAALDALWFRRLAIHQIIPEEADPKYTEDIHLAC